MLRKFWRWLLGESDTHLLLLAVMEQQAKVTESVMEASKKQSEVLQTYINLFKPTDANDVPQRWESGSDVWDKAELTKMGFPFEKSEAEQTEWVLSHVNKFDSVVE